MKIYRAGNTGDDDRFPCIHIFDSIFFSYVLLHHMMGELEGIKGVWGYPEGGMGAVTQTLAKSAAAQGVQIFTDKVTATLFVFQAIILINKDTFSCEYISRKESPEFCKSHTK